MTAYQIGRAPFYAMIRDIRSASVTVDVSDVAPTEIRYSSDTIHMGLDTAFVSIYLSTSYPTPVTLALAAADGTVSLGASTLVFEPGVTRLDVQLQGLQPGTTTITATDVDKLWTPGSAIVVVSDGSK